MGTGTGIWATCVITIASVVHTMYRILTFGSSGMADEYPSAKVTGVDLSPIQPPFVPPNCVFEIDDVTLPWTYAENQFDFIHVRELFGTSSFGNAGVASNPAVTLRW